MLSDAFIELIATANPIVLNARISARQTLGSLLREKGASLEQVAELSADEVEAFLCCETPQYVPEADLYDGYQIEDFSQSGGEPLED